MVVFMGFEETIAQIININICSTSQVMEIKIKKDSISI